MAFSWCWKANGIRRINKFQSSFHFFFHLAFHLEFRQKKVIGKEVNVRLVKLQVAFLCFFFHLLSDVFLI